MTAGSLGTARAVADAVLYEGYLLYPYRASARKNQVRWQFGVLGPAGAAGAGVGEEPGLAGECLVRPHPHGSSDPAVTVVLRCLQLQTREVQEATSAGFVGVKRLSSDGREWLSWDEAVEVERTAGTFALDGQDVTVRVDVEGGEDIELLRDLGGTLVGRVVRRRRPLVADVAVTVAALGEGLVRLRVAVDNASRQPVDGPAEATSVSLIGTHVLLHAAAADFVSLRDAGSAQEAADACRQNRCWPVLVDDDVVLVSPIILDDRPELAPESAGALFDSTEIDEILTLRILTLTDEEKAEARATDPRAAEILDRCEEMSPDDLARLHGTLREPRALLDVPTFTTETSTADAGGQPWWDPEVDASVDPAQDSVLVDGVAVTRGSLVRIAPSRRADAQDIFFAGQVARVAGVHHDVDGGTHVAVVLVDDPAAELHDWYGRYLYFAPDEVAPLSGSTTGQDAPDHREESRP